MKPELLFFYLQGRAVKSLNKLRKYVADPDEIAETIRGGTPVRTALTVACSEAAKQYRGDRKRKAAWIADSDNNDAFTDVPDKDAAWDAYCEGMGDELAYAYEADVLDALDEWSDDDDDDDDGEGDDGEGDDDDDDDKPKEPKK